MISYMHAIILGLLQGFSELFPISSLGHTVLLPAVLNWHIDRSSNAFVAFVVLTHFATALVLLGFFWRDWLAIIAGIVRVLAKREIGINDTYGRLGWLLIVSTVPAGLLGLLLEHKLQALFGEATVVAVALACNGAVLYGVEQMRNRQVKEGPHDDTRLAALSWTQAVVIGLAQCFALIPGFSRTGLSMTGALLTGLSHENAVRYSFLLATPIIFAAAVLKLPDLFTRGLTGLGPAAVGGICAAVTAYFSVRFLVKYFETRTLTPFAIYCMVAGLAAFVFLLN
ncbi:undecaprenyl-diphosphate phosphatase [Salinisphaera sp. RV14]|uniref:undecaprenyl-diphosphate phosphatase n=1 Tax=Salinisphaera sp. RV14 TaxID=3454140 RepID=UPI003F8491D8